MPASIVWYDLETFGLNSKYDRIAQLAALRTDDNLEPTGQQLFLYSRPAPDYLPNPLSCLVHGITPQYARDNGVSEYELAQAFRTFTLQANTTTAGFNSLHFDDEFIRNLFYRNLYEPYEREWKNGNSKWDIIDLMRAAHDLRPDGIVWPSDDTGRPVFTLEALSRANGIAHESAHDAMHDVLATIDLARLVRQRQPKLFSWYWQHRTRKSLVSLVDLVARTPLIHTSVMYTSAMGCTTLVAPVAMDPENRNQVLTLDLRFDPAPIIGLSAEELARRIFTKSTELDCPRIPLSKIMLNRCPFLAPATSLDDEAAVRLGIDKAECAKNLAIIKSEPELLQRLAAAFEITGNPSEEIDPELQIYSGSFFPNSDLTLFDKLHSLLATEGPLKAREAVKAMQFRDERADKLVRRFFARNFPQAMSEAERRNWRTFCASRLQLPPIPEATDLLRYKKDIMMRLEDPQTPAHEMGILHALLAYKTELEKQILSLDPN